MNALAKYSNSTFLYFLICIVGVIFPLGSFFKNRSAFSIEELQRLKSFIINDLAVTIPISVRFGDSGFNFPDLVDAAQIELDYELSKTVNTNWKFKLINELLNNRTSFDDGEYILELTHSDDNFVTFEPNVNKATVHYTQASVHANDLPFFMTQATLEHLVSAEIELLRLINSSEKVIESPFIDAKIIIIGLQSKNHADIFEENFTPLKSFMTDVLGISNITISVIALESFAESNSIFNSTDSLYYLYSDIDNEIFVPNKTIYQNRISHIYNNSITNEDATYFASEITDDLKRLMGFPKNNLGMNVNAMKRYLALKKLIDSIDHLININMRGKSNSEQIGRYVSSLYPVIDCLHKNESKYNWNSLLVWSREFKETTSRLLEDSYVLI